MRALGRSPGAVRTGRVGWSAAREVGGGALSVGITVKAGRMACGIRRTGALASSPARGAAVGGAVRR